MKEKETKIVKYEKGYEVCHGGMCSKYGITFVDRIAQNISIDDVITETSIYA